MQARLKIGFLATEISHKYACASVLYVDSYTSCSQIWQPSWCWFAVHDQSSCVQVQQCVEQWLNYSASKQALLLRASWILRIGQLVWRSQPFPSAFKLGKKRSATPDYCAAQISFLRVRNCNFYVPYSRSLGNSFLTNSNLVDHCSEMYVKCPTAAFTTAKLTDFVLTFPILKTNELTHNISSSTLKHH